MTVGEKIKAARKNAGLTQEQMAQKLMISRPAVAKWESDKGIPDIENLKALSQLLGVSIDYLLDDGNSPDLTVLREAIDLAPYGKGRKKKVKDRLMKARYPGARVITLVPYKVLTRGERIIDNLIGFFTSAGFGTADLLAGVKLVSEGIEYYLVEQDGAQFLVKVGNEFLESRRMVSAVDSSKEFIVGDLRLVCCGPLK